MSTDETSTQLDALARRIGALTENAARNTGASADLRRSLESLRQEWEKLRAELQAVESIDARWSEDATITIGESLRALEQSCARHSGEIECCRIDWQRQF
ncbi:MAG: hypothetical protein JXO22_09700 [Phycisphaerae bacterium]|nr:hypothetical protein [Phycisphaerae bacterium]